MKQKLITNEFFNVKTENITCTWGTPNNPIQIVNKGNCDIIRFDTNVSFLGAGAYTVCDILPHNYAMSYGIACLMVASTCVGFASLIINGNVLGLITTGYGAPVTIQGTVMAIRK